MSHSPAHALPAPFADPLGSLRAARLTAVTHPAWCDRTRCEVRVGAVRHIGHPVYWQALAEDVEFSLSKFQRDDGPTGYLFGSRHLAVVDIYEEEWFDGDFDALLVARMRVQLAEQEIDGDPRDDAEFETGEATFDAMMAEGEPAEIVPDIADTVELPAVKVQVTASTDHG